MNAIVTRLIEVLARQKPVTAADCEELLAAQLNPGDADQLRVELEQTLASHDQLKPYLRELEGPVPRPSPCSEPFDDQVVAQLVQHGLRVLSPGQLARLAISPLLLLDLWDTIDDEYLSPYWLGVVQSCMHAEEERRGSKFPTMHEMVATAKRNAGWVEPARPDPAAQGKEGVWLMQAAGPGQGPSPAHAPPLKRWEKEINLSQAEWLSRDDPAAVASLEAKSVVVEFSWLEGEQPTLEIRLIRGPLALPGGSCTATLLDRHGKELDVARVAEDCLVFGKLPPGGLDALVGSRFICNYSIPGAFVLKIVVLVDPNVAEDA